MLRPPLLRDLAVFTRDAVRRANGARLDLAATTDAALCYAGRGDASAAVRESACDVVEACIYALGGEVQS